MNVEELTARQLTAILEELPHGVGVLSQPGTWRYVNTLFMLHLGISPLEDKLLKALEHLPELRQGLRAVLEGERDTFDLGKLSCPPRYLNVRVRSANDGLTLITTSDVSAAVASEQAAVQSMLEWQEAERRQLSQEIHDGVGPLAFGHQTEFGRIAGANAFAQSKF
jgi:signal transduction histidine kinase